MCHFPLWLTKQRLGCCQTIIYNVFNLTLGVIIATIALSTYNFNSELGDLSSKLVFVGALNHCFLKAARSPWEMLCVLGV